MLLASALDSDDSFNGNPRLPHHPRMDRRRFLLTSLAGALVGPLVARAQPAKLRTIGFLGPTTPSLDSHRVGAFVQRLRDLGWIEGRNVAIEYRWGEGRIERLAEIAAELVRLKVDVIVTGGTPQVVAVKQTTSVIPIVFAAAGDPVGSGLVASLARPGGNVTGLSIQATDLAAKRLGLLREVTPVCAVWRSWPTATVAPPRRKCARFRQRPARLASKSSPRKSGARRTSRLRGAQGSRGGTLCLQRPTRNHEPDPHQHLGVGRAAAGYV